jgi:pimeloyl-ACP methyl ester carboxylesterase
MNWSIEDEMVVRRFGAGRELVWIHGLGEQSSSFDQVARMLDGYAHVLVDMPGYGRSPWPREPSSLDELADRIVRFVGDRRPILAGHSMGGVLAQLVAERVAIGGIVNIDGNLTGGDCSYSRQAAAYTLDDFIARGYEVILDDIYKRGIADPALRGYYAAMRAASPHVFHRHSVELVALSDGETLARRFAALDIPVCFIAGGVDGGLCARSRAQLEEHRVRWCSIEPSGHWPFIDQPAAFVQAVRRLAPA